MTSLILGGKEMSSNVMLCDGDCGNVHYEIDLFETCYSQMLCNNCMFIFTAEREDGRVYDAITGEE